MKYMDENLTWARDALESGNLIWTEHVQGEPFTNTEVESLAMSFEGGGQWEDGWGAWSPPKGTFVPANAECDDYIIHRPLVEADDEIAHVDVCYNGNEELWMARLVVPGAPDIFAYGPCPDRLITFLGRLHNPVSRTT